LVALGCCVACFAVVVFVARLLRFSGLLDLIVVAAMSSLLEPCRTVGLGVAAIFVLSLAWRPCPNSAGLSAVRVCMVFVVSDVLGASSSLPRRLCSNHAGLSAVGVCTVLVVSDVFGVSSSLAWRPCPEQMPDSRPYACAWFLLFLLFLVLCRFPLLGGCRCSARRGLSGRSGLVGPAHCSLLSFSLLGGCRCSPCRGLSGRSGLVGPTHC